MENVEKMPALNLGNTKIAFAHKSKAALKKAKFLFSVLANPWLVSVCAKITQFALKVGLPIKGLVRRTIYKQFVGGETIEKCKKSINELAKFKIDSILDYSVEGKINAESFEKTTQVIIETILYAQKSPNVPLTVFKVTGIISSNLLEKKSKNTPFSPTEQQNWEKGMARFNKICKAAASAECPVMIDAEESWIQPAIDEMATTAMEKYNAETPIVYNTIQLYCYSKLDFLKTTCDELWHAGKIPAFKLVRGAYMEKERARATEKNYTDPIQPNKAATDKDFDAAVAFCIKNLEKTAILIGTHNENSCILAAKATTELGIDKNNKHLYFSQLLGMSDHISFNMADAGYNVAKYVPFGPVNEVLPYLVRRAKENTSVAGQTSRELTLLTKEIKRRNRHTDN